MMSEAKITAFNMAWSDSKLKFVLPYRLSPLIFLKSSALGSPSASHLPGLPFFYQLNCLQPTA